jgi:hypothetical protein
MDRILCFVFQHVINCPLLCGSVVQSRDIVFNAVNLPYTSLLLSAWELHDWFCSFRIGGFPSDISSLWKDKNDGKIEEIAFLSQIYFDLSCVHACCRMATRPYLHLTQWVCRPVQVVSRTFRGESLSNAWIRCADQHMSLSSEQTQLHQAIHFPPMGTEQDSLREQVSCAKT